MNEETRKTLKELAKQIIENAQNKHDKSVSTNDCPGCHDIHWGLDLLSMFGE